MSVDPLAEKYPAWSPYNYVMNNPVNLIDPTGMGVEDWIRKKGGETWIWDENINSEEQISKNWEYGGSTKDEVNKKFESKDWLGRNTNKFDEDSYAKGRAKKLIPMISKVYNEASAKHQQEKSIEREKYYSNGFVAEPFDYGSPTIDQPILTDFSQLSLKAYTFNAILCTGENLMNVTIGILKRDPSVNFVDQIKIVENRSGLMLGNGTLVSNLNLGFTYQGMNLGSISITFESILERNLFLNNLNNVSID